MNHKLSTKYFLVQWAAGLSLSVIIYLVFTLLGMQRVGFFDLVFLSIMIFLSLLAYAQSNIYLTKSNFDIIFKLFLNWTLVLLICLAALFLLKISDQFSRLVLVKFYVVSYLGQIFSYFLILSLFKLKNQLPNDKTYVLAAGIDGFFEDFSKSLSLKRDEVLIGNINPATNLAHLRLQTFLGEAGSIELSISSAMLEKFRIQKIYLSYSEKNYNKALDDYLLYSSFPVEVIWHLKIEEKSVNNALSLLENFPFISLTTSPQPISPIFYLFKRLIDFLGSIFLIALLSPVAIVIAIAIKTTSTGPIIFQQKRHGLYGKEIIVYKFRSMYIHQSDRLEQARADDDRITPIGRLIRRSSLDELPQLLNVLHGTLSLVGPRPHPVEFDSYYGPYIHGYMTRHRIKPGITGLAQINGARGETDTLDKMLRRIRLDLDYINNQTILMDFKILFLTPFSMVIYEAY